MADDHDDEPTPVDTPRARRSSVSVSTAELILESLAARLSMPGLSPERLEAGQLEDATGVILDYCRAAISRAIAAERREGDKVREELRLLRDRFELLRKRFEEVQRDLSAARNYMRPEKK